MGGIRWRSTEVENVAEYLERYLGKSLSHQMRMLNVEVLQDFDRICTILFVSRSCIEDTLEGFNNILNNELVFLSDKVSALFILFAEQPSVDSLCYRNILLVK